MKVTKFAGRGADHPPPSKCRGQERAGLYLYSPSGPQWPVIGRAFYEIWQFVLFLVLFKATLMKIRKVIETCW